MAKVVVFEGPDKVGKDTQSKLLAGVLQAEKLNVVRVEPTKEFAYGKKVIYSMLESGSAKKYPNLFQFVQFVNRLYFQWFRLPALMKQYDIILCDRWALSGYIYGKAEGLNEWLVNWMYNRAYKPDLTLVFSGASYRRAAADDSYEKDTNLQAEVKRMYRLMGQILPNHVLIDNQDTVMDVHHKVVAALEEHDIL